MDKQASTGPAGASRREFMKLSATVSMAALLAKPYGAYAQASNTLRVGVIGCGRRGTGAVEDCLKSSDGVDLVAMGDVLPDKLKASREKLSALGDRFKATDDTCFTGFDAYQKVIASDVDVVLLTAPPAFRPQHLKAAVEAGKHVFMEKPCAVDPVGVRSIIESSELAKQKNLSIVCGTQRRHQACYVETVKRIHDGAIGDITAAQCYWIGDYDYYTAVPHDPAWSDMEWQLRNWNYFTWLSGDHIVEQHVHNIDVINWVMQSHPEKAIGMGGRQQRTGPEFGHIYDHFAVEFEYANGVRVESLCRQMKGLSSRVAENVVGTKGSANPRESILGANAYKYEKETPNPYVQEHADLIRAIRSNTPINEGVALAESTMAGIMGRLAAYSGREISWRWIMNASKLDLTPPKYEMGPLPVPPVAIPGQYELV